ncbi:helix-turn-helix domain-containing protein [Peribacillus frigoritolerans]|uniref:helix-turn-helix domain-containing protein n=1 Tax=Peribacillus frigoritolerans TaxID=450367 RepID=UPI001F4FC90C|nr:helix-turn-helix transcriptional regulator [Peribacillus frigoritolerans]MCK2020777.1 helix-turn-helix transcriptional regulator [Peribacillus frigoritolerans]
MSVEIYVDIEKILKSRGLTLTQLADKTGIHKQALSRIKIERAITFRTLNKIASALGEEDPMSLISVEVRTK